MYVCMYSALYYRILYSLEFIELFVVLNNIVFCYYLGYSLLQF